MNASRLVPMLAPLAALLLAAPAPGAQTLRYEGWDDIRDERWVYDPDDRPSMGFVVRDTSAARNALDDALERLADGDAEAAARAFVDIAERYPDHVIQVDGGDGRWVGAGELALYMLETAVPSSAVASVDDRLQQQTVAEAVAWRDVPALRRLARRLEGQPAGRTATLAVARLLAERGEVEAALMAAERVLQLTTTDDDGEAAQLVEFVEALRGKLAPADETDAVDESVDDLTPRWSHELTTTRLPLLTGGVPDRNVFSDPPQSREAPFAPIHPVIRDGVAYVSDTVSVTALNPFSGRVVWHHAGPLERATVEPDVGEGYFTFDVYAHHQRDRAIAPTQLARPVVTERMVVATQQVLETERPTQTFDSVPINWPLPHRRIVALDRFSGEELWRQERPVLGPDAFVNTFDVHGPVVVQGGVVYAAGSVTQGSINAYVAAFDQSNGDLLWRTFVCLGQQDLTMFNRPFQEHVTSPPLLHDGALYLSTNLGVVACVDAWSGRTRWVVGYEQTPRRVSRSHMQNQIRPILWTNLVPQMADDVLVIAPLDSIAVLGLDPQTGRDKWAPLPSSPGRRGGPYRHQPLVLSSDGGPVRDRLLVVGEDTVEMFDARTGAPARPELFGSTRAVVDVVTAPAVLADRTLLLPTRGDLVQIDVDRWVVEPERIEWPDDFPWGRRVRRLVPGGLVTLYTDHHELYGALDDARVEERLSRAARTSPSAQVTLGEVRLGAGRFEDAVASFTDVLAADGVPDVLVEQARGGLLAAAHGAADLRGTPDAWDELLTIAAAQGRLAAHASEGLEALADLGADEFVDAWVERLFAELPASADDPAARRRLLELLVSLAAPRFDERKAELARRLGEDGYADALAGDLAPRAERIVPALPGPQAEPIAIEVPSARRLVVPRVHGTPSPALRRLCLVSVHGEGRLLAVDVARGAIAWDVEMPGGVLSVNTSNVHFAAWRDRLVVKTREELAVLDLATGEHLWSRRFEGAAPLDVVVHSGLVLVLVEDGDDDALFTVRGHGLETGVTAVSLDVPRTIDAQMFTTGDRLLVLRRVQGTSIVGDPVRHMLTIDPLRGRVLHETPLPRELEVLGEPFDAREAVLFRDTRGADVTVSSWSARTRRVEWSRDLPVGSAVLVPPGSDRLVLVTTAIDRTTGERHDIPVSVDVTTGAERSADGGGIWHVLFGETAGPHDRLVMLSGEGRTLRVMDGRTIDDLAWIERDEKLTGGVDVAHGRGGFALMTSDRDLRRDHRELHVFVASGDEADSRRTYTFEAERSVHQAELALVDGALVVTESDTIRIIRDPEIVTPPGDQR